eukprot:gb/GECG01010803.1/.p1 GENE.gb/GECG01010803.1/~~gb/GECG01010803.1/.p1  ORF type:complete len:137 (+),score=2.42 gb/GECG01010803.1/:1-411(+)
MDMFVEQKHYHYRVTCSTGEFMLVADLGFCAAEVYHMCSVPWEDPALSYDIPALFYLQNFEVYAVQNDNKCTEEPRGLTDEILLDSMISKRCITFIRDTRCISQTLLGRSRSRFTLIYVIGVVGASQCAPSSTMVS